MSRNATAAARYFAFEMVVGQKMCMYAFGFGHMLNAVGQWLYALAG